MAPGKKRQEGRLRACWIFPRPPQGKEGGKLVGKVRMKNKKRRLRREGFFNEIA